MKNFGGKLNLCTAAHGTRASYHFTYSGETIYSEIYHFACYIANWEDNNISCSSANGHGVFSEEELRALLKETSVTFSRYTIDRRLRIFVEKGWWD